MRTTMLGNLEVELPDEPDSTGRENFGYIKFEHLVNTRDLGGMRGVDGRRIKPGLLLRSGALGFGSAADIAYLRDNYDVRLVIDLRNDSELAEVPDPMDELPHARYVQANILKSSAAGISQDAIARVQAAQRRAQEMGDPVVFMEMLYPRLLQDEAGIEGYQGFFYSLLSCDEGTALWHCYVGRDRCGMASMLIQAALGVSRADMEQDYLATNLFTDPAITAEGPASLRSFAAAYDAVERSYGSILGYIVDELEVTRSDIEELQARYLE